jgi:hypothetical protein
VTKVVFDVVSLGLENVERFVFNLPASTAAGGEFSDIVGSNREVGDEAVAIGDFAAGVDDLDLESIDEEAIFAAAQRNVADPAAAEDGLFLTAFDRERGTDALRALTRPRARAGRGSVAPVAARLRPCTIEPMSGGFLPLPSARRAFPPKASPAASRAPALRPWRGLLGRELGRG